MAAAITLRMLAVARMGRVNRSCAASAQRLRSVCVAFSARLGGQTGRFASLGAAGACRRPAWAHQPARATLPISVAAGTADHRLTAADAIQSDELGCRPLATRSTHTSTPPRALPPTVQPYISR